jgi:hypothetical protein
VTGKEAVQRLLAMLIEAAWPCSVCILMPDVSCLLCLPLQLPEAQAEASQARPSGAFGQRFPQNCATRAWSESLAAKKGLVSSSCLFDTARQPDTLLAGLGSSAHVEMHVAGSMLH